MSNYRRAGNEKGNTRVNERKNKEPTRRCCIIKAATNDNLEPIISSKSFIFCFRQWRRAWYLYSICKLTSFFCSFLHFYARPQPTLLISLVFGNKVQRTQIPFFLWLNGTRILGLSVLLGGTLSPRIKPMDLVERHEKVPAFVVLQPWYFVCVLCLSTLLHWNTTCLFENESVS